jgi:hypothetical protein
MDARWKTHVYSFIFMYARGSAYACMHVCIYAYVYPDPWSELHSLRCFQICPFIFANILYSIKGPHGRKDEERKKERVSYGRMKYGCRDADIAVCENIVRAAK